jgi:hypothetical protein
MRSGTLAREETWLLRNTRRARDGGQEALVAALEVGEERGVVHVDQPLLEKAPGQVVELVDPEVVGEALPGGQRAQPPDVGLPARDDAEVLAGLKLLHRRGRVRRIGVVVRGQEALHRTKQLVREDEEVHTVPGRPADRLLELGQVVVVKLPAVHLERRGGRRGRQHQSQQRCSPDHQMSFEKSMASDGTSAPHWTLNAVSPTLPASMRASLLTAGEGR